MQRLLDLNETFLGEGQDETGQNFPRPAGRSFNGAEIFEDLFWGRGNSRLSWLSKICCDRLKARLVTSKFSKIVLGGTAAPYAHRVWGAVIFFIKKSGHQI